MTLGTKGSPEEKRQKKIAGYFNIKDGKERKGNGKVEGTSEGGGKEEGRKEYIKAPKDPTIGSEGAVGSPDIGVGRNPKQVTSNLPPRPKRRGREPLGQGRKTGIGSKGTLDGWLLRKEGSA